MSPVVHFELPFTDQSRMIAFYTAVFGWQIQPLGEEMGNYALATTTTTDARPDRPAGSINGGFFPRTAPGAAQHPSIVIAVTDIRAAMERVIQAGGQVLGEPEQIPDVGLYVPFIDSEGNRNSMLQPRQA